LADELAPLSEREMEILRLVATGATNQQIAQDLVISVNTVKVHLRNIYAKLGVASRTEASMLAVRQGWVAVSEPAVETEEDEEKPAESAVYVGPGSALPPLESWPRVSTAKRASLVVAMLLALAALVLPLVHQSRANTGPANPIMEAFPTAPPGPPTTRWMTRAQMPTPRTGLAVVAHEGLIYAIGGISNDGVTGRVEIYDPESDTWTSGQAKPTPAGYVSAVEVDGLIYVPGGIDAAQQPLSTLEVYDPVQDSWLGRAPLPEPLGAYGLAALGGQIYLFGGRSSEAYVASVYRYDPEANTWSQMQPMDKARGFLGAAPLGELIYVAGGYDDVAEFSTFEAYDPAVDSWTSLPPMTLPRGGLAVVPVREQIYAIGGGLDGYLAFNERFDPRLGTWTQIETPVKEEWQGLGAAFVTPSIHAIGGWSGGNLSVNEAYRALFQSLVPLIP
jgi:DNA-binding CsgD family transcriptional regulator